MDSAPGGELFVKGSSFGDSIYVGGYGADVGYGVAAYIAGFTYFTSFTFSPGSPLTLCACEAGSYGDEGSYLSKFNPIRLAISYGACLGESTYVGMRGGIVAVGFIFVVGVALACPGGLAPDPLEWPANPPLRGGRGGHGRGVMPRWGNPSFRAQLWAVPVMLEVTVPMLVVGVMPTVPVLPTRSA